MPGVEVFIDANVLLYARDIAGDTRGDAATLWLRELAGSGRGHTNLQVLNEVTNVMLRRRRDLTAIQIFAEVDGLRPFGSAPLNDATVDTARLIRLSGNYSWWDCLLLASALELGCTHFLSEDLQDGQVISDSARALTILDPFAHSPEHILSL